MKRKECECVVTKVMRGKKKIFLAKITLRKFFSHKLFPKVQCKL